MVARWIIDKVRINKLIKRLWISSVTDKAIKDGFANLKPGKAYDNLYASAVARSEADWYIGLNATRALTTRFNAQQLWPCANTYCCYDALIVKMK